MLWNVNGQLVDDQQEGVQIPENATRVQTFRNQPQYGDQEFAWEPQNRFFSGNIQSNAPGYLPELFGRLDRQRSGQLTPWEAEELGQWEATARATPTRDIGALTAGWQGETGSEGWWNRLDPGSPDAGGVMLALRDKMEAGTASEQERALYGQVREMAEDWDYRASVPQESDANPFGLGDNLFGALFTLGLGSGMAGLAPLAAGTVTAGSLGAAGSTLGGIANLIGPATGQDWLTKAGLGLGLTGTLASLPTMLSKGVTSLSDAARLAQTAGRVTGTVGQLAGNETLGDIGTYLGAAGQLGSGVDTLSSVLGSGVTSLTDAASLARGLGQVTSAVGRATGNRPLQQASSLLGLGGRLGGGVQNLLGAAGQAQQRGTAPPGAPVAPVARTMTEEDWLRWTGQPGPWQPPGSVLGNL
jgi:hypothetical protein